MNKLPYPQETIEERIAYYEEAITHLEKQILSHDKRDKMLIKLDTIALRTNQLYIQMLYREKYNEEKNSYPNLEEKIEASSAQLARMKTFLNSYSPCKDAITDKTSIAWILKEIDIEEAYLFQLIQSRKPQFTYQDLQPQADLLESLNQERKILEAQEKIILQETDELIAKARIAIADKEPTRAELKEQAYQKFELTDTERTLENIEAKSGFNRKLWDYRKKETWHKMLASYRYDIEELAEGGIGDFIKTDLMPFLQSQGFTYSEWDEQCDENGYFITIDGTKYTIYTASELESEKLWLTTHNNMMFLINHLLTLRDSKYKFSLIRGSEETYAFDIA